MADNEQLNPLDTLKDEPSVSTSVAYKPGAKGQLGSFSAPKGTVMSSNDSKSILENMQKMLAEYDNPMNKFENSLQKAHAWTLYDKEPAFRNIQEQEELDRSNKYNIMQNMAAFGASQNAAQNKLKSLQTLGAGAPSAGAPSAGAPTTGGNNLSFMSPPAQAEFDRLMGTGRADEAEAFKQKQLNNYTDARNKAINNPQYNQKLIDVAIPDGNGGYKLDQISMAQLDANPELQKYVKSYGGMDSAPAQTPSKPPLQGFGEPISVDKLYSAIYGQESSSGAADTSKPNQFGVQGPMQIKKETFEGYQKNGVIPKEWKIDDPKQNLEAGKLIINDLYKKHKGDVDKVAAEYYAGPKGINKDGTINRDIPGGRPKDPSVGEYVDQVRKRIQAEPTSQKKPAPSTISELKDEQALEKERRNQLIASDTKKREAFETDTKPVDLERARAQAKRAIDILRTNPNVSGVISSEGVKNAILQFADGKMPNANLQDVLFTAMADSNLDINQRRELAGYLAESEIRGRGLIKGTGAISDYEQKILSKIAGSISDPAEVLYKRFRVFDKTNEFNLAARKLWDTNEYKSMRDFEKSEKYQDLYKAYVDDMDNVYNEKADFSKARTQPSAPNASKRPPHIDAIIKKHGGQ